MLQVHRWFILIGIVFIVFITLSVDFRLSKIDSDFKSWKKEFIAKLETSGISQGTIAEFDNNATVIKEILEPEYLEQTQSLSVGDKASFYVNDTLLVQAQNYYEANFKELQKKEYEYSVSADYVVAMMGVGSMFQTINYQYRLLDVLSTYSVGHNNFEFYEAELIAFLRLVDRGSVYIEERANLDGTFTALGITPTAYLLYGVDGDNNGVIDLNKNQEDIYETAFYLLNQLGWVYEEKVAQRVILEGSIDPASLEGVANSRTIADWKALGFVLETAEPLDQPDDQIATLIMLDPMNGLLLYDNFNALFKTTSSVEKGVAVSLLGVDMEKYSTQMKFKQTYLEEEKDSMPVRKYTEIEDKIDDLPPPPEYRQYEHIK